MFTKHQTNFLFAENFLITSLEILNLFLTIYDPNAAQSQKIKRSLKILKQPRWEGASCPFLGQMWKDSGNMD
jgi:hypothetical protein